MEFRLVQAHVLDQMSYRMMHNTWIADRLVDVFVVASIPSGMADAARKKHVDAIMASLRVIQGIADPFASLRELEAAREAADEQKRQAAQAESDRNKTAYLEALSAKGGYSSLGELQQALTGLSSVIKEMQDKNVHTAPATNPDER